MFAPVFFSVGVSFSPSDFVGIGFAVLSAWMIVDHGTLIDECTCSDREISGSPEQVRKERINVRIIF